MVGEKVTEYKGWNKEKLLAFEQDIADIYEAGKIKAPVHLSDGEEESLIQIFSENHINHNSWIFSTWRSHYHWLLSGRDPKELKKQILDGKSMHIFGHRFFTSSIVGGISPIALGVADALKRKESPDLVYCFVGCMGASIGITQECIRYASGHNLPIRFIIEINGLSVRADTLDCWGREKNPVVMSYKYERKRPHAGSGRYVMF